MAVAPGGIPHRDVFESYGPGGRILGAPSIRTIGGPVLPPQKALAGLGRTGRWRWPSGSPRSFAPVLRGPPGKEARGRHLCALGSLHRRPPDGLADPWQLSWRFRTLRCAEEHFLPDFPLSLSLNPSRSRIGFEAGRASRWLVAVRWWGCCASPTGWRRRGPTHRARNDSGTGT